MDSDPTPATARGSGRRTALAYVRTSTVRQGERDGPERQQRCILRYAREHGIDVVETFQDKVSGTRKLAGREGLFQRLDESVHRRRRPRPVVPRPVAFLVELRGDPRVRPPSPAPVLSTP